MREFFFCILIIKNPFLLSDLRKVLMCINLASLTAESSLKGRFSFLCSWRYAIGNVSLTVVEGMLTTCFSIRK